MAKRLNIPQALGDSVLSPRLSSNFDVGSLVWSPCHQNGFRRSVIMSVDEENDSFVIGDGTGHERVRQSDVRPLYDAKTERTCDDNTALVHLDDANILDNLQRRFMKDEIYTYTANVLLAVNPYKPMGHLYSDKKRAEYRGAHLGALPPHPYAIVDCAFRNLLRERTNQALVISGESGAGKTETAKIVGKYLAAQSRTDSERSHKIQDRIVSATPILESFGNASTVRNRNSSRFGKYSEMFFDRVGSLIGAGVKTFLLESSRVVSLQDGEQNYHVFYEMLAGLDDSTLKELGLERTPLKYRLLRPDPANKAESSILSVASSTTILSEPKAQFAELQRALNAIGANLKNVWAALAALLHLGEVSFACGSEGQLAGKGFAEDGDVAILAFDRLERAARLLGVDCAKLQVVLQKRCVRVGGQEIMKSREPGQAQQTLQCIVKAIYQRIFDDMVAKINKDGAQPTALSVGTLDIYGFESLQINSFEQLCINLANERLQQFFIEEVLRAEQRMYKEEGLIIETVEIPDHEPIVQSIHRVLDLLNDHSIRANKNLGAAEPDQKFCEHVHRTFPPGGNSAVTPLKLKASRSSNSGPGMNDGFKVTHYAADVSYLTRGWIEKNNDSLVPEIEMLFGSSRSELVSSIARLKFVDSGERVHTVAKRFVSNLDELLETLKGCAVHYIRCFNPNHKRQNNVFDKKYVLDQVVQCGTVHLVRMMHHGYPHRCKLRELRQRFANMLPKDIVENYSNQHFALAIMMAFEIDQSQWKVGNERLFFKAGQLRILEQLRDAGSTATQDTLRRVRKLFALKRIRCAINSINFARWLPRHVQGLRRNRFALKLGKILHIFVALHRWLRRAKRTLYGVPEETVVSQTEVSMYDLGLTSVDRGVIVKRGNAIGQSARFSRSELFVALNCYESGSGSGEQSRKTRQSELQESIIFFDGRNLVCTRIVPSMFQTGEGSVIDPRLVDLATGKAFSPAKLEEIGGSINGGGGFGSDIACVCQHRCDKQIFASCDDEGHGIVWRWRGASGVEDGLALWPLGCFRLEGLRVLQMCFLPELPTARRGPDAGYTLAAICAVLDRHWMMLMLVSVRAGSFVVTYRVPIGLELPNEDACDDSSREIAFLVPSLSGHLLCLGGRGMLRFYHVTVDEGTKNPTLVLVEDAANFADIQHGLMVSCVSMPSPARTRFELFVIGDDDGRLYAWKFDAAKDGSGSYRLSESSGRFRGSTHDRQVPIRAVIRVCEEDIERHHKQMAFSGLPYGYFLKVLQYDSDCMYSLGGNGKLLCWRRETLGWTHRLCCESTSLTDQYVAGCASMLVPHILIIADVESRKIICYNRTTGQCECSRQF